jgi:HlyD family secretion protein
MRGARRQMMQKIAAALDPERRAKFEAIASDLRRGPAQADAGAPARVYVPGEDGAPKAVSIRIGVTDGSHTEVLSGELQPGAAVIVGGGPRPQTAQAQETSPASRPRGPRLF